MIASLIRNASIDDIKAVIARVLGQAARGGNTRTLAEQIVASSPDDPITAISYFVRANYEYTDDPTIYSGGDWISVERIINPELVAYNYLQTGEKLSEDCDGVAVFIAALGASVGIPSRVVIADTGSGDWDHAYAQLWSKQLGDWVTVDVTTEFPAGWNYNTGKQIYVTPS